MEKQAWTGKRRLLAGGSAAVLLLAGFLSGVGIKRLMPAGGEEVPVYSVEGLRDKKWSDAVAVSAVMESGSLTACYYDSRKPAVELYVKEGQLVESGTPLLRYDCTALSEELSGLEKSLANQRIYLERLGAFIGMLRATKPRPDGLGRTGEEPGGGTALVADRDRNGGRAGVVPVGAGAGKRGSAAAFVGTGRMFLSAGEGRTAPVSAEESLEGFVAVEGRDGIPEVHDRVDGDTVPSGGTGTAQDPYVYYVKKGGEVAPEVLAMLVRMKLCGRFVIVEDGGSAETPLFVWTFDGKVYEEIVQGETSSGTEPSAGTEPSSEDQEEGSSPEESSSGRGEGGEGESSSDRPVESNSSSGTEGSVPESSGPEESPSQTEESIPDTGETPPEFDGPFDDEALEGALGGLESEPGGYTKEELARAIRERSLEYENLELAIRKNELQAENLRREIEENILTAETAGQVREARDPREAARLGQPVLTIQGKSGNILCGQVNEMLAAALRPGDRLSVSARVREKEVSFEAVLQSVEKEPGGGTDGDVFHGGGTDDGAPAGNDRPGDASGGRGTLAGTAVPFTGNAFGNGAGNPAMSYYRFTATPSETKGVRAGEAVEILIPRMLLGESSAENETGTKPSGEAAGGIVLPDGLLFYEGRDAFVYAMDEDGRLEKRPVETGRSFGGQEIEILSGLTGEDYLAYPEEASGMEGAEARIVYGEEMEIKTEETEEWEETEP